jgi:colanic acid biosynthesis protein WcaH
MLLPTEEYKKIITSIPIVCIDIIIQNSENKYLLVKRINEPLKGDYWVPGGRIMHCETIDIALNRILMAELKIDAKNLQKNFIGVYQDFFTENSFESKIKYHTISIVHKIFLIKRINVVLDNQSEDYIWSDELPSRFVNKTIK